MIGLLFLGKEKTRLPIILKGLISHDDIFEAVKGVLMVFGSQTMEVECLTRVSALLKFC